MKAEGQLQRKFVTGFTKTAMNVHDKIYRKKKTYLSIRSFVARGKFNQRLIVSSDICSEKDFLRGLNMRAILLLLDPLKLSFVIIAANAPPTHHRAMTKM